MFLLVSEKLTTPDINAADLA